MAPSSTSSTYFDHHQDVPEGIKINEITMMVNYKNDLQSVNQTSEAYYFHRLTYKHSVLWISHKRVETQAREELKVMVWPINNRIVQSDYQHYRQSLSNESDTIRRKKDVQAFYAQEKYIDSFSVAISSQPLLGGAHGYILMLEEVVS